MCIIFKKNKVKSVPTGLCSEIWLGDTPLSIFSKKPIWMTPNGLLNNYWGERGIRTLGTIARALDFESSPFDHSGISPKKERRKNAFIFWKILICRHVFWKFISSKAFYTEGGFHWITNLKQQNQSPKSLIYKALYIPN